MKKYLLSISLSLCIPGFVSAALLSQTELDKIALEIQAEAMLLYRSESASWFGTDVFMSKYKGGRETIGGYFSYTDGAQTKCVFFSKQSNPDVIGTVVFDSVFSISGARLNETVRKFNDVEEQYYQLRIRAADLVQNDSSFKYYKGTNLNFVPLADGGKKRVYVLTSTTDGGVVLYGNDYLIEFGDDFKVRKHKALHSSLIPAEQPKEDQPIKGFIHTHIPGYSPFISPTDICTTKLFEQVTGNGTISVVSEHYVSVWSGKSLKIFRMPDKKG